MVGSMIISQVQRLSLLLTILFVVACILSTTILSTPNINHGPTSNKLGEGGLTLNLIHRDLIYPPSKYKYDQVAARLGSNLSKPKNINQTSYHEKHRGVIYAGDAMFYVNFYIGTPGVRQIASLDTGSPLLWVQCAGFQNGHRTLNSVYNESKSSSYIRSFCRPRGPYQYCQKVSGNRCDEENRCAYDIDFADGSHSRGHIGFETISFSAEDYRNRSAFVSRVLFGCGTDNNNTNKKEDGVFGIGGIVELSIVGQTNRRFSFCFASINDRRYKYNHLALGNDAILEGVEVPYQLIGEAVPDAFGVTMDYMSIGPTFRIPFGSNFTVMIDTGSSMSYFKRSVYNNIKTQVARTIGVNMQRKNLRWDPERLCYESRPIWWGFPNVTLVSHGESLLVMDIEGMFEYERNENILCLAIAASTDGYNVLGAIAMQYHNVGFDLGTNKAYFKGKRDCRWAR